MAEVKFAKGLQTAYDNMESYDDNTLYYCTDTGNIYLGSLHLAHDEYTEGDGIAIRDMEVSANVLTENGLGINRDGQIQLSLASFSLGRPRVYKNGAMTGADKEKLDGIAEGAEVNVQSDWSQSNTAADDYIKNKPTIPSAGSSTPLMDGTASAGSSGNYSRQDHVHPSDTSRVPTTRTVNGKALSSDITLDTSDLTNNAGFITSADVADYTVVKLASATEGYIASYELRKDGVKVGATINIPKDYLVKSGSVETVTQADVPYQGAVVGDKYLDFVVNTIGGDGTTQHIYIPVNELVDAYTAGSGIEISGSNVVSAKVSASNGLGINGSGQIAMGLASSSAAGAMSSSDKSKLDGISSGAEVNVQSDWNQTDSTADDYIKNKPKPTEYHAGQNVLIHDFPKMGGYTRLESAYNSASTYISTNVMIDVTDMELEIRIKPTSRMNMFLLGRMSGTYAKWWFGLVGNSYNFTLCYRDDDAGSLTSGIYQYANHIYTIRGTFKNGVATLYVRDETNGTEDVKTGTFTPSAIDASIQMFRYEYNNAYMNEGCHVYHAVIRRKGKTIVEYVPMKRNSDDAVGFLNTVSGTFVQATSGSLNYGAVADINDCVVSIPPIPTNTSDLTNDAGFITSADVPSPSSATPLMDGTSAVGTSSDYARGDHRHPTDTSRAPLASPAFTGTPTAPTAAAETNTTQVATTAFVKTATNGLATDSNVVHKTGDETINGSKTFNDSIQAVDGIGVGEDSNTKTSVYIGEGNHVVTGDNTIGVLSLEDSNSNAPIVRGVHTPIANADAANKEYVDNKVSDLHDGLADVALSGSYNDLSNTPTIPVDSNLVHKTGNETIAGEKEFTGTVRVPEKQSYNDEEAAPISYVDDAVSDVVHKSGAETITGAKTFEGNVNIETSLNFPITSSDHGPYLIATRGNNVTNLAIADLDDDSDVRISGIATPTANNHAANKSYVDNAVSGLPTDASVVHKAGTELITGSKVFSGGIVVGQGASIDFESAQDEGVYVGASDVQGVQSLTFASLEDDSAVKLSNIATPGHNLDAANKAYVDAAIADLDTITIDGDTLVVGEGSSGGGSVELTREYSHIEATAGSNWSGKGKATVKNLQGSGIVVWNQMVTNGDFSQWDSGRFLPNGWTNGSGFSSTTYMNVSRINEGETLGIKAVATYAANSNRYMYCTIDSQVQSGHTYLVACWLKNSKTVAFGGTSGDAARITFAANTNGRWAVSYKKMTANGGNTRLAVQFPNGVAVGDYFEIRNLIFVDLTVMYGVGNEPNTSVFRDLFPYYYPKSSKTLLGTKFGTLMSFGYNLFMYNFASQLNSGRAPLCSGQYVIEGTYTSLSYLTLRNTNSPVTTTPEVDANGVFSVTQDGWLTVSGADSTTCVHRYGDGSRSGYEEHWSDGTTILSEVDELPTLFPYGLLAIGNARDEIVTDADGYARRAIQRIGIRAYQSSDASDTSVVTDGTHTAYVLETAVEHTLSMGLAPNGLKMFYDVDSWGEETFMLYEYGVATLPARYIAEYEKVNEAVNKVDVDGDLRNIEDWRIEAIDGTVTASGTNPVTGAAVKNYVDGVLGDVETLLENI